MATVNQPFQQQQQAVSTEHGERNGEAREPAADRSPAVETESPSGRPPDHMASMPTEYTPAFLVRAYDEFLTYITSYLGDHIFNVLQMMRTDAEAYAKSNKTSPEAVLSQLLAEIKDWRHLPVEKGDSATVLDEEVDAVKTAVPHLMNAVEDALRTGAMVLSGARGTSAEAISVKVPPVRDFVHDVYTRIAKQYAGRDGVERLMRHLSKNKDKLLGEVKHASTSVLFPRESVWGQPEEKERVITVPPGGGQATDPNAPPAQPSRKTIPLNGDGPNLGEGPEPGIREDDLSEGDSAEGEGEGGSGGGSSGGEEEDGF